MLSFRIKNKQSGFERLPRVMRSIDLLISEERTLDKDRAQDLDAEYDYMQYAVRWARMIAQRRKIDPDLAAIASVMMNIGRIISGQHEDHAQLGYEPAKQLLAGLGCFTSEEIELVATAVKNHSRRDIAQGPLDEIVKDVDIYVRYLQGQEMTNHYDKLRLNGIRLDLSTTAR